MHEILRTVADDDIKALRELLRVFDGVWLMTPINSDDFVEDARLGVARVVISRQWESLRATDVLAEVVLAHLAVAYVRHACDEWLWMKYLVTLQREQANMLLALMSANDVFRSVVATQSFFGDVAMVGIGFRQEVLDSSEAMVDATRVDLLKLGRELGWPKAGKPPTTAWIAGRVGEKRYYDYIFSASSRSVHFSAGETLRKISFGRSGIIVDEVELQSDLMTFAIDALLRLYVLTFRTCARLLGVESWPRERVVEIQKAISGLLKVRAVPFITAEDLGDHLGGRRPST